MSRKGQQHREVGAVLGGFDVGEIRRVDSCFRERRQPAVQRVAPPPQGSRDTSPWQVVRSADEFRPIDRPADELVLPEVNR